MNRLLRMTSHLPAWVTVVLAVLAMALGVALIIRPTTALDVLALLIGGGLVIAGLLELLLPLTRERMRTLLGVALIVTGVAVLILPGLTVRALASIVGIALIVRGVVGVAALVTERDEPLDRRVAEVLLGVAAIAFGVLAIMWPDITLLIVGVVFGATLVLSGGAVIISMIRGRRRRGGQQKDTLLNRWMRTIGAVLAVVLAAGAVGATVLLREGSPVVDEFYAAPRTVPEEPGQLIRADEFTRDVPEDAIAWRILYTTTHGDDTPAIASGVVVVPREGAEHPVIAWHHGTTGFDRSCAPTLAEEPFRAGALFVLDKIIDRGWALVATDYIGLGTAGPHPYMVGEDSARAELDAVRAARQLDDVELGEQTLAWGHSQGGGAALWSAAVAEAYAPDVPLAGAVALAPATELPDMVDALGEMRGGSVFASFVMTAYSQIYPDVTFREYVRPGAEPVVREMAHRCLAEPAVLVSVLDVLALLEDPDIFAVDPGTGALGERLRQNVPPSAAGLPVFIGQGQDDPLIREKMQTDFVGRLCEQDTRVDFRTYQGRDHLGVVLDDSPAVKDAFEWTEDRLAGVTAPTSCDGE